MKHCAVILAMAAVLATAGLAGADVIVESTFGPNATSRGGGTQGVPSVGDVSWDIDLVASSNTVLLLGTSEPWDGVDATAASIGGSSMTQLVDDGSENTSFEIWAIDLGTVVAGTQTITVEISAGSSTTDTTLFAVQLSNATLDGSLSDTGSGEAASATLSSVSAGSYVFGVGSNTKGSAVSFTGLNEYASGSNGVDNFVFGGDVMAASGDVTVDLVQSDDGKGAGMGVVAIQEVPEPATMSLLAIGGLGALIRRRR